MICDVCRFNMGHDLGPSGRCEGCGTPLGPAEDHTVPGPGVSVLDGDEPYIVSEDERLHDPRMEGRYIIFHNDVRWGRGIGAETYGYYTKKLSEVVDLSKHTDHTECPECGDNRALHKYGFDGCVASYTTVRCNTCSHEFVEEFDC